MFNLSESINTFSTVHDPPGGDKPSRLFKCTAESFEPVISSICKPGCEMRRYASLSQRETASFATARKLLTGRMCRDLKDLGIASLFTPASVSLNYPAGTFNLLLSGTQYGLESRKGNEGKHTNMMMMK
jgi:hypothetical protein